jgi:hypothetical protein
MQLQLAVRNVFGQLEGSLFQLMPWEYGQPCLTLSGNTIGQHVRHIIELFQALETGYECGLVNYEKRIRDKSLENERDLACSLLSRIREGLDRPDKDLVLHASYDEDPAALPVILSTNYYREIAYNLEHTIHHMALIRIGIKEINSSLVLPEDYGIASATIKYRKQCAQ